MKSSSKRGKPIFDCEVLWVSRFGIWLLFERREFYLNRDNFPWFHNAPIESVFNVKALSKDHLYWPDLDVDLHLNSLEDPQNYPLIATGSIKKKSRAAKIRKSA